MTTDPRRAADELARETGESIVCMTYPNCDLPHVGGAGGTPCHLPPDGKVVPGLFDHGIPSDALDDELEVAAGRAALVAEVTQLREAAAAIEKMHYRAVDLDGDGWCDHCADDDGHTVPWPCPTITALRGGDA